MLGVLGRQPKSALEAHLYESLHGVCIMSASVCIKCASSLHFYQRAVSPRQTACWFADFVQNTRTFCKLCADSLHTYVSKVCSWRTVHTYPKFACTPCTHLYWLFKVCIMFQTNPSKNLLVAIQHDAHAGHTRRWRVQVVRQLYRRFHLHVGLEDAAAAERCLVVGLLRLGLDRRLHQALGDSDVRGNGVGPAYGSPVARPVHHDGVRLLRAPKEVKGAFRALHAKRKLLLEYYRKMPKFMPNFA